MEFKKTNNGQKRLVVPPRREAVSAAPAVHHVVMAEPVHQTAATKPVAITVPLLRVPGLPNIAVSPKAATYIHVVRRFFTLKKLVVIAAVAIVLIAGDVAIGSFVNQQNSAKNQGSASYSTKSYASPDFQTVLPAGKSVGQFGGWKRVSPAKADPVFAYEDSVDGVTISVSEQQLPASMKADAIDAVASLATKFNATDQITAGNTTAYVGTSAKGPQSVLLTKNNLLVMIKSESKIADKSWSAYVQSLN